jgi:hypothetical protein
MPEGIDAGKIAKREQELVSLCLKLGSGPVIAGGVVA